MRVMKIVIKLILMVLIVISSLGIFKVGYYQVKAELAQHLMETAWSKAKERSKPWPWADTWPVFKLILPSINASSLVLKDASGESLAFGPGLMTPKQVPGKVGNTFIAAHRDTHFENVGKLISGDKIVIQLVSGESLSFKIDIIQIVNSKTEQANVLTQEKRITLVTCYPFNATQANTPFRYLVSAVLIV